MVRRHHNVADPEKAISTALADYGRKQRVVLTTEQSIKRFINHSVRREVSILVPNVNSIGPCEGVDFLGIALGSAGSYVAISVKYYVHRVGLVVEVSLVE